MRVRLELQLAEPGSAGAADRDDIAYDNHDIDDGLRRAAHADMLEVPLVGAAGSGAARYPDVASAASAELVRHQIGYMVADLLAETAAARGDRPPAPTTCAGGPPLAGFSAEPGGEAGAEALPLRADVRRAAGAADPAARAGGDRQLFAAYRSDPASCPRSGGRGLGRGDRGCARSATISRA
jgi:hypothetical protein